MKTISDDVAEFISDIDAVVEATGAECQLLWETRSKEYVDFFKSQHQTTYDYGSRYSWCEASIGYLVCITNNTKKPTCISIRKADVDGVKVLFWHPTSQYVNYKKIEKWLDKYIPREQAIRTDAMNFSHFRYAKEKKKLKVAAG